MSAVVQPAPVVARADDVLGAHAAFSATLGLSRDALELRRRLARQFLAAHPDMAAWMATPLPGRLADLRRIKAWPLISWMVLSGRLRPDIDLLVGRHLGGMHRCAEALAPAEFAFLGSSGIDVAAGEPPGIPRNPVAQGKSVPAGG